MKVLERITDIKTELPAGERVVFVDKTGKVQVGSVRIKVVFCGKKTCRTCPHAFYAYAQYREGKKVKEKYIGIAR